MTLKAAAVAWLIDVSCMINVLGNGRDTVRLSPRFSPWLPELEIQILHSERFGH